jgi:hypothetical protein
MDDKEVKTMTMDWEAYQFLAGEWEGDHSGKPGEAQGRFTFTFELDGNILVRRSRTVFPDTPERTGYTHDDLLMIYTEYTGMKRGIYFDNEEHVIHYEVEASPDGKTITLVSDPAPSAPQFRFVYKKTGSDTLDGRFEIAPPGQPGSFQVYIEGPSTRVRK